MKALAIDSAVSRLVIAAKNDEHTVSAVYDIGMRQSETLLPAVDYVLGKSGITVKDLDYTSLTIGPGSFTGLRIALAALKALEQAGNVPVYGISTLEAYAHPYRALPFTCVPIIDAKKDRFYTAVYSGRKTLLAPGDYEMKDIISALKHVRNILFCGPDAGLLMRQTAPQLRWKKLYAVPFSEVTTDALFACAEQRMADAVPPLKDFDGPEYLRASEAEVVQASRRQA